VKVPPVHSSILWFLTTIFLSGAGALILIIAYLVIDPHQSSIREALIPIGGLLAVSGCAPLLVGMVKCFDRPSPHPHRCGLCTYYQGSPSNYTFGTCSIQHLYPIHRSAACDKFIFSERAMVHDTFCDAEHALKSSTHKS
jgi:hypothetical protein